MAGGGAVSGTWLARGSCSSSRAAEPDGRRRRLRRAGPDARSGFALSAGGAATAGGSGISVRFARECRLRLLVAQGLSGAYGLGALGLCFVAILLPWN